MKELNNGVFATTVKNQSEAFDLLQSLSQTARSSAVYSEPIEKGEYTLITAAEVSVGLGFGYGMGGGSSATGGATKSEDETQEGTAPQEYGGGGGGGGGGGALSRPVAAIAIGPKGIEVEPIVDVTKVALAFFTMIGSFLMMLGRMRQARRSQE